MPARKPNLLWRTRTPIHSDLRDTMQLQTVIPDTGGKLVWVTVATGTTEVMNRIALHLSETRYELFPLVQYTAPDNASVSVRRIGERKPPKRIEQSRKVQQGEKDNGSRI